MVVVADASAFSLAAKTTASSAALVATPSARFFCLAAAGLSNQQSAAEGPLLRQFGHSRNSRELELRERYTGK